MKAFLSGVVAMIIIAVGAGFVLNSLDLSSAQRTISDRGSVRLDGS